MTAQMASESRLRTSQWLKNGCNGFNMKSPISNPMSFWTEQDVLLYIRVRQDEYDSNLRDCNLEVKCSADKRRRKMARNYIKKHKPLFSYPATLLLETRNNNVFVFIRISDHPLPPFNGSVLCIFRSHHHM